MNNKLLKIMSISVMLVLVFNVVSFAKDLIIPEGIGPNISASQPKQIASNLIGALKWIGYVIAIGMIIYVGIKYTMAAADEKANMKGVLVKVVIGALIIFLANTIVNIAISLSGA